MEFRDLRKQYQVLKREMNEAVLNVMHDGNYIMGKEVDKLEDELATYVGVKNCISCANGTDALQLVLMVWNIGMGDAVFVPDFTFFSTAEVVAAQGATPVFVDIDKETYNISTEDLIRKIECVKEEGKLNIKAVIAVDLFGLPADYSRIEKIAEKYGLKVLEDGAQGFGGSIDGKKACSFGELATTSFFPAKPLGCYGDGGAIFTDSNEYAELLRSYRVHGKGSNKYDNVYIGRNSRLDTIQAAILRVKLRSFISFELENSQKIAQLYNELLGEYVELPLIPNGFCSSYAQYTIRLNNKELRDEVQQVLKENEVPTMIYYSKPLHRQKAFEYLEISDSDCPVASEYCNRVLSIPFHPFMETIDINKVAGMIRKIIEKRM